MKCVTFLVTLAVMIYCSAGYVTPLEGESVEDGDNLLQVVPGNRMNDAFGKSTFYPQYEQKQSEVHEQNQQMRKYFPETRRQNQASFGSSSHRERFPLPATSGPARERFHSVEPHFADVRADTIELVRRLPANATLIRPNLVGGFSCEGKLYGYYADPLNDCQVYHVCLPLRQIFPRDTAIPDVTYVFSFICNEFLSFDQQSMTCGYKAEVTPCNEAQRLYDVNSRFFQNSSTSTSRPGHHEGSQF